MRRSEQRWWTARLALAGLLMVGLVASLEAGAKQVRVGREPAPVVERRSDGASVVHRAAPGAVLEVLGESPGWYWVLLPEDSTGTRRVGWISATFVSAEPAPKALDRAQDSVVQSLHTIDAPALPAPRTPADAGASGPSAVGGQNPGPTADPPGSSTASSGSGTTTSRPDSRSDANPGKPAPSKEPPGKRPTDASKTERKGAPAASANEAGTKAPEYEPLPDSARRRMASLEPKAGRLITIRSLRGNAGLGYERVALDTGGSSFDERGLTETGGVAASLAVLDPGIFTVDASFDAMGSGRNRLATGSAFNSRSGLRNYRVELTSLTGLGTPLRLFADHTTSDVAQSSASGGSFNSVGTRTGQGFTWDLRRGRAPHIQLSASTGRQFDRRDDIFGFDSETRERRGELRANQEFGRWRYDFNFTHGTYTYAVPRAGVLSTTANDLLNATTRVTPVKAVAIDVGGRFSQYRLGVGGNTSRISGAGGNANIKWDITNRLSASAHGAVSTNAFEALLSGAVAPGQDATPVVASSAARTRTQFQDVGGQFGYSAPRTSLAFVARSVRFGVPPSTTPALDSLRTLGITAHAERSLAGVTFGVGGDATFGRAVSNLRVTEPYRELGAMASVSRFVVGVFRVSAEGSLRRTARLSFYPVSLTSRLASLRFEFVRPQWARPRASITVSQNTRDVLYSDNRDGLASYSFGLSSRWYDVAIDINQSDTNSLLLPASVLGTRQEALVLLASRPDLFRGVIGAGSRGRAASVSIRPFGSVQVHGRLRRDLQVYPGLYVLEVESEQVWATFQLRQLQIEFGWDHVQSFSIFSAPSDRRIYVRIRREFTIF